MSRPPRDTEHGRKIGKVTVKVGNRLVTEDLRLDSKGVFFACHQGVWVSATTQDELKSHLVTAVREATTLTWTRIIRVEYRTELAGNGYSSVGLSDEVDESRQVEGFQFDWKVYDVSSPHRRDDASRRRRSYNGEGPAGDCQAWREMVWRPAGHYHDDDEAGWYPARSEAYDTIQDARPLEPNEVEYTEERHQVLLAIRAQVRELDARLRAFLGEGVAARLDAVVDVRRLLTDAG